MIKLGDTYFMFASMMTGWDANDNQYTTSKSLSSGWSEWKKFADRGSNVSSRPSLSHAHIESLFQANTKAMCPIDVQFTNDLHP